MANICKKCGQEEKHGLHEEKGAVCSKCFEWYHLKCVSDERGLRKGTILCDTCAQKLGPAPGATAAATGIPFEPSANSTSVPPPKPVDHRDAELQKLREKLAMYELKEAQAAQVAQVAQASASVATTSASVGTLPSNGDVESVCVTVPQSLATNMQWIYQPGLGMNQSAYQWGGVNNNVVTTTPKMTTGAIPKNFASNIAVTGMIVNPSVGDASAPPFQMPQQQHQFLGTNVNNVSGIQHEFNNSSSWTIDRSQWRSRLPAEVLRRTQEHVPLTRDQIARRKTMNTVLPKFRGNPLKWLRFITAYLETAGTVCGFSTSEDMDRVRDALQHPALTLVKHLLHHPDNLESVLGVLQMAYGETSMILAAMSQKVDSLPPLDENLRNIALFAGRVDQLRNINNLMDAQSPQIEIVLKLERKLPLVHAVKWLQYKAELAHGPNTSMFQIAMGPAITGTLNHMADFLFTLYKTMANLNLHIGNFVEDSDDDDPPGAAKPRNPAKKTVLLVNEQVRTSDNVNESGSGQKKSRWQRKREQKKAMKAEPTPPVEDRSQGASCPFKCGNPVHKWQLCPEFKKLSVPARWNWTKKLRRCFVCFGDHQQTKCEATAVCNINQCNKRHHALLHPVGVAVHEVVNLASDRYEATLFRIASVLLTVRGQQRRVLVLLDPGASVTLIDPNLAAELGSIGKDDMMALSWADGEVQPAVKSQRIKFDIVNPLSGEEFTITARTYDDLRLPANKATAAMLQEEGLSHLPINCDNEVPLILMGQDNTILMRTLNSIVGSSGRVVASETPLGFVVEGERVTGPEHVVLVTNLKSDSRMEKMLTKYIEEEHFGLQPDETVVAESDDVVRARQIMQETTKQREDGRYETGLLWTRDDVVLPNNRVAAVDRTRSFMKKLQRNPELCDKVESLIQSHWDNGYVRRVDEDKPAVEGRTWYLPIFNVHNPMKPDKVRLVFDAAAEYRKVSLNSMLLSGPDLTVALLSVLLRFRTHPVAISGDLQDMFHRVYVREEDQCAQRFVWPVNGEFLDFEMCVLTFGATCSPTLAQHVKNLNADKYASVWPAAVSAIKDDHYIDDWLGGGCTEEEVVALTLQVKEIHAAAGFVMHKFMSNSENVLRQLGIVGQEAVVELSTSTILGMTWVTVEDTMALRFRAEKYKDALLDGSLAPTKREMLSVVMSIYDPLGLVSFITIELKNILREAWREKAEWDTKLGGGIQRRWREWLSHLVDLQAIVVPRWYGTTNAPVTLHIYVDASETATAAVCYVVQRRGSQVIRSLVMAKCLVAPLKTKSIPRLELDAAVLGIRVRRMVVAAKPWNVEAVVFWTDAKDVLWWLRSSTRRYSPYVANRVSAILSESTVDQWHWTPTDMNPADWGTKWNSRREDESLWWHGPEYLAENEEQWPNCVEEAEQLLEVRPLLMVKKEKLMTGLMPLPVAEHFSKWIVYRNACAYAVKFITILQQKTFPGPLNDVDVRRGEAAIFRQVQAGLLEKKEHATFLSSLAPFVDELGVLRMRGRTARSDILPADARFPVIVVGDHPAIVLLIHYYHHMNGHQNTTAVVNELRQKVVMPHIKARVKRVISWCRWCAVKKTKPIVPQLSALPMVRMAVFMPSFSYMGIDYFGPQNVLVGRRHEKRWGVVMTCLTTRAVYLEVAHSLSTESCIAALDSLVARRGLPLEIHSDNATCFVGASKEFVGPLGHRPIWSFIPPRCPSMGGAWERLVGIVKRALEGMVLPKTPTDERWRHALVKIERLINSRPLTDVPVDPEEEESLTPNHFLFGSSNGIKPQVLLDEWEPREALKKWDEVVDAFYVRFVKEYLPSVSARTTCKKKTENVSVGDIVFLCDDDYRAGWIRAEVIRVLEDKESNQVRQVYVRTADGKEYRRATSKIAPIVKTSERGTA